MDLREDASKIIDASIKAVLPDEAVRKALLYAPFLACKKGKIYMVACGKAAWQMASAASEILEDSLHAGIVVTKYGHVKGDIWHTICYEAGHPVPDGNSFKGTQAAIDMVRNLTKDDTVLLLLSGGGSALFEKPFVSEEELADITRQLLACGADIKEINVIRKRLSAVKGGRFAKLCEPAHVYSIILSDVLGDSLDMIASGPAYPDSSTSEQAVEIVHKYDLHFSDQAMECMKKETPKELCNVETCITGSVRDLCAAAAACCEKLGYKTSILTDYLECEAKEAGKFLAAIAKSHYDTKENLAYIVGGETVVYLTGSGKGGRNQELVLAAADGISGLDNVAIFSIGSDGTDGPTDAAGGYCDGFTKQRLVKKGISVYDILQNNDAYHALQQVDGLVITGPTGTNVNDVAVLLIQGRDIEDTV